MKDICQRANVTMAKASLAWLLQDNVSCVIVGASSPDQIVENVNVPTLPDVRISIFILEAVVAIIVWFLRCTKLS